MAFFSWGVKVLGEYRRWHFEHKEWQKQSLESKTYRSHRPWKSGVFQNYEKNKTLNYSFYEGRVKRRGWPLLPCPLLPCQFQPLVLFCLYIVKVEVVIMKTDWFPYICDLKMMLKIYRRIFLMYGQITVSTLKMKM